MRAQIGTGVLGVLSLLLSASALASVGVGSSGGGAGVVCREANNKIKSVEVLDLYEARKAGLELMPSTGILLTDYINATMSFRKTVGDRRPADVELVRSFESSFKSLVFSKPGQELPRLFDEGPHASIPADCDIEQIAIWHSSGVVQVSTDLWAGLSTLDQAALLFHEPIYQMLRDNGEVTAVTTRNFVAHIFSARGLPPERAGFLTGAFTCGALTGAESTDGLIFWLYKDVSKPQSTFLKLEEVMGHYVEVPAVEIHGVIPSDGLLINYSAVAPYLGTVTAPFVDEALSLRLAVPAKGVRQVDLKFKSGEAVAIEMKSASGVVVARAGVVMCNETGIYPVTEN
jgi:hypothetical protein